MEASLNPFVYDSPLAPADIVDREAQYTQLVGLAEGGHNTRVQAPRRYGKTTLLGKVAVEAERIGMHTVYVDFYRAVTLTEVARRIEEAYLRALGGPARRAVAAVARRWQTTVKLAPGGVGAEAESRQQAAQQRLSDVLDLPARVHAASGQRTLVVFDEFQDLLRIDGEADGLLRSKIQFHRDQASYIFAGSEPSMLAALFSDRQRPLFEQARPIDLPPLADDDLSEYIGQRFEQTGREPGEALDELLALVRGHPQRAMLAAHHLWEQTPADTTATADTFTSVLEALDRETGDGFERAWNLLADKPNQRKVLAALANSDESLYNSRTLDRFGLAKGAAESAVNALAGRGEVVRAAGGFRLVDPLFERWLQLTQT